MFTLMYLSLSCFKTFASRNWDYPTAEHCSSLRVVESVLLWWELNTCLSLTDFKLVSSAIAIRTPYSTNSPFFWKWIESEWNERATHFFFWYIYWLCYCSCPISPPHSNPSCPPPPSHIPPYSSCPWVIFISSLASTFPTLFLPSPCLFSTYHLCYLFSVPFPPSPPPTPLLTPLHVISISMVLFLF